MKMITSRKIISILSVIFLGVLGLDAMNNSDSISKWGLIIMIFVIGFGIGLGWSNENN